MLVAIGLVFAGAALIWADQARTDDEGFISTNTMQVESNAYAVVTRPIELEEEAIAVLDWISLTTVRVQGSNNDTAKQIFIGIASDSEGGFPLNLITRTSQAPLHRQTRWHRSSGLPKRMVQAGRPLTGNRRPAATPLY